MDQFLIGNGDEIVGIQLIRGVRFLMGAEERRGGRGKEWEMLSTNVSLMNASPL
jgi:hypothetical protein